MEINRKYDEDISAATPPLEAKTLLFSLAVTGTHKTAKPLKLLVVNVKRAYFQAKSKRSVYVQLPEEDFEDGKCGKLAVSMYGTRDAAQNSRRSTPTLWSKWASTLGFPRHVPSVIRKGHSLRRSW